MAVNGVALASVAAGAVLVYSGIKGKSVLSLVQSVIQGRPPTASSPANQLGAQFTSSGSSKDLFGTNLAGGSGGELANKALGRIMAAKYGWATGDNWSYLESGWEEESGWSTTAANVPSDPYNNAYGIPQANPGTKMASQGSNWKTSAATQIAWGLDYIKNTYGSPVQVPLWSASGPLPGYTGY